MSNKMSVFRSVKTTDVIAQPKARPALADTEQLFFCFIKVYSATVTRYHTDSLDAIFNYTHFKRRLITKPVHDRKNAKYKSGVKTEKNMKSLVCSKPAFSGNPLQRYKNGFDE